MCRLKEDEIEYAFQYWISSLIEITGADVIAIDGKQHDVHSKQMTVKVHCIQSVLGVANIIAKTTKIANMRLYFIEFLLVNKSFMPTKVKQHQALIQNYPVKHPATI